MHKTLGAAAEVGKLKIFNVQSHANEVDIFKVVAAVVVTIDERRVWISSKFTYR